MREREYVVRGGQLPSIRPETAPISKACAVGQTCLTAAQPSRTEHAGNAAGLSKLHNITTPLDSAALRAVSDATRVELAAAATVIRDWERQRAERKSGHHRPKHRRERPRDWKREHRAKPRVMIEKNGSRQLAPVILRFWREGSGVEIEATPRVTFPRDDEKAKKRKKITRWSNASRFRLKWFLATLSREEVGRALVLTLTYPAEFPAPDDHATYKNHLRVFYQGLCRQFPGCSGVWKLEFQKRGAAHFHLICFALHAEQIETLRSWIEQRWYQIAHNGDAHLGKAACNLERIKTPAGGMTYLVKYVSKGDQTMPGNFTGRYWGCFGKEELPVVETEQIELTERQANIVRRWLRHLVKKKVEQSRWNHFLSNEAKTGAWTFGGRMFWEQLKSIKHGGGRKMIWGQSGENWSGSSVSLLETFKLPKRSKTRANEHLRVMGDVPALCQAVKTALERGLLPR